MENVSLYLFEKVSQSGKAGDFLKMNILVTGGAGYIGSHIVDQLIRAGYQPFVIDDLSSGYKDSVPKGVPLYQGNVGDCGLLENFFKNHKISTVIHCAAFVSVDESVKNPSKYYENNVSHSVTLLRACEKAGIGSFIFSSSAAVYGEPENSPVDERSPTHPINPYGETKLMFEKVLRDSCAGSQSKMNFVIYRYFNVAGADTKGELGPRIQNSSHLIQRLCQVISGSIEQIEIFGTDYPTFDGTCIRDFIHVEDLAIAHIQALEYLRRGGESDIFNCGYGRGFSVKEVVENMKKVSGVDFKVVHSPPRQGDPSELVTKTDKIQKILGWSPKFNDLSLICKTALDWEQKKSHKLKNQKTE